MNRELINLNLIVISQQLTHEQILWSRRFRDWKKFDKLTPDEKLIVIYEELEIWINDIDPNFKPIKNKF
jgi:hypothetical protein